MLTPNELQKATAHLQCLITNIEYMLPSIPPEKLDGVDYLLQINIYSFVALYAADLEQISDSIPPKTQQIAKPLFDLFYKIRLTLDQPR